MCESRRTSGTLLVNSIRLSKIDETLRPYHHQIREEDECFFLHEYTANKGFAFSNTNSLISNLKKKPSESHKPGYHHKARCIRQAAQMFAATLNPAWLETATIVPIPGSKARDDPDYDDRMERICHGIGYKLDVRTLVKQNASTRASHEAGPGNRVTLEELLGVLNVDEDLTEPEPVNIGVFDDVLTNGTHFRAIHTILSQRFPNVPISGFFIARTVHPNPFEDFGRDL